MPTFIDESGDVGPGEKSAPYFRLGAVWFESFDDVQHLADEIAALRARLGLKRDFEFHFAHLNDSWKVAFFETVVRCAFNFVVCSFQKSTFIRNALTKDLIRDTTVTRLVMHLNEWYLAAEACKKGTSGLGERIVYDQCDDPEYIKLLKTRFRSLRSGRGDNKKLIGDVNPRKSKVDPCLQLADMICGATGRHLDGQSDFYNLFQDKTIKIEIVTGNANRPEDPSRIIRPA